MKAELLNHILGDKKAKHPVVLATWLDTAEHALIYPDRVEGEVVPDDSLITTARDAMRDDKSGMVDTDKGQVFLQVFNPPLRMIIVGAVHIAQPLARMAIIGGYDVTVVDPRGSFATEARFPGVRLMNEWPDDAVAALAPDPRTAVVTLTHDPKIDDPALHVALESDAFYIGALGSRKTHASRLDRLTEAGYKPEQMNRIFGPVGLSIGAVSPSEIAVSILAQVTEALHHEEEQAA